jgi:Flp pilus assembly pilin Flp
MSALLLHRRPAASIRSDQSGAAALEFALIAPLLVMFMLGLADMLYNSYATSILSGAVQKAGRDQTLQINNSLPSNAALDAQVLQLMRGMAPTATASSTRRSYPNFAAVATPERFTDSNGDGDRDVGECYVDINGNGTFDLDPGISGDGGASDAVLYTMRITYPRLFPLHRLIGGNGTMTISASTVLKNQPWADQTVPTPVTRCT